MTGSSLPEMETYEWKAPSNIALVKYWGKHGMQLPANPSLSLTLNRCFTRTSMVFRRKPSAGEAPDFAFSFEGAPKPEFEPKIRTFFERILPYVPWLKSYIVEIDSSNSFPHSSGIASSASSMAALSLGIMSMEEAISEEVDPLEFFRKASFLSRLGSGSACRSLFGGYVGWGAHPDLRDSSDLYGSPLQMKISDAFFDLRDTILIVEEGSKSVSSTVGHGLMEGHPFATERFHRAGTNLADLLGVLQSGETGEFIRLVESEALMLHAMMMTGTPYFMLMKPNTLEIIQRIWAWRKDTGIACCFTLDAGANVHLLYPGQESQAVESFIYSELGSLCQEGRFISDRVGPGPERIWNEAF